MDMGALGVARQFGDLRGQRILIVEDNVLIAMMIEQILVATGATVVGPAHSVDEALALVAASDLAEGLSAAVLDFSLSNKVVLPVADCLVAMGVPFVFCTGHNHQLDRGRHMAAPVLIKPYQPAVLVAVVEGLVKSHRELY